MRRPPGRRATPGSARVGTSGVAGVPTAARRESTSSLPLPLPFAVLLPLLRLVLLLATTAVVRPTEALVCSLENHPVVTLEHVQVVVLGEGGDEEGGSKSFYRIVDDETNRRGGGDENVGGGGGNGNRVLLLRGIGTDAIIIEQEEDNIEPAPFSRSTTMSRLRGDDGDGVISVRGRFDVREEGAQPAISLAAATSSSGSRLLVPAAEQEGEGRRRQGQRRGSTLTSAEENDDGNNSASVVDGTTTAGAIVSPEEASSATTTTTTKRTTIEVRRCSCAFVSGYYPENDFYCPTDKSYCYVPRTFSSIHPTPSCVNASASENVTKTMWPIIVVWFCIIGICLVCTVQGRNAVDCVLASVFPCWNDVVIKIMRRRNPDRVDTLIRRFYWRNRQRLEERYQEMLQAGAVPDGDPNHSSDGGGDDDEDAALAPSELRLKTRIFRASEIDVSRMSTGGGGGGGYGDHNGNGFDVVDDDIDDCPIHLQATAAATSSSSADGTDPSTTATKKGPCCVVDNPAPPGHHHHHHHHFGDDEEEDDPIDQYSIDNYSVPSCTICFVPLEDGDRVGALPCTHVFHVDCLKVRRQFALAVFLPSRRFPFFHIISLRVSPPFVRITKFSILYYTT